MYNSYQLDTIYRPWSGLALQYPTAAVARHVRDNVHAGCYRPQPLSACSHRPFGAKHPPALASLLHIPIRLRAKSLEQRPALRTTQRRDLRKCIRDHTAARSDHHATLALPRPIAQRIDDAADRLREA